MYRGIRGSKRSFHSRVRTLPLRRLFAVDGDAFHLRLRLRRLGHHHGQHPILERCRHFLLIDIVNGDAAFKSAIVSLAEQPILVLHLGLLLPLMERMPFASSIWT